jgi:hypothetical protein
MVQNEVWLRRGQGAEAGPGGVSVPICVLLQQPHLPHPRHGGAPVPHVWHAPARRG